MKVLRGWKPFAMEGEFGECGELWVVMSRDATDENVLEQFANPYGCNGPGGTFASKVHIYRRGSRVIGFQRVGWDA